MQERTCPRCKQKVYSANAEGTWRCCYCGCPIPPPEKKKVNYVSGIVKQINKSDLEVRPWKEEVSTLRI